MKFSGLIFARFSTGFLPSAPTFAFNLVFVFAGRSFIALLPLPLQYFYNLLLVVVSTLWLNRTWGRSPDRYPRANLASTLCKQFSKLKLNFS